MAGLLIAGHGVQKVSFRLSGSGLAGGTQEFRHDGFRGGALTALAAGAGQIGSGPLLAAVGAIGVMTVAVTVKWPNGLWVQKDGYEYPLVLIALAAALAFTGPGRHSADQALGLLPWSAWWAVTAVAVGAGSGLAVRARLHRHAPLAPVPSDRPSEGDRPR
ncbi:DoxX protein [Streptomyces sp. NPDC048411]|uniref:DoxX family protein n=1 Tax=Streptomyces sp. NPDC048411 TaxID=3157206 RepID=UPI003451EB5D